MRAKPIAEMSYLEFLKFEEASDDKHEFVDGEIYSMAGGSIAHGALSAAMTTALSNALAERRCRVLSSDVRIRVAATDLTKGLSTYPDVSIVYGQIEIDSDDPHGIMNPTIIVEVQSPSTEGYDRGEKFQHYRRIPALREYVLVSYKEPRIEIYRRNERNNWELVVEAIAGQRAELTSCGDPIYVDVDTIYRDPLA